MQQSVKAEDAGVEVQVCLQAPGSVLRSNKGDEEPPETSRRSEELLRGPTPAAATPATAARWLWVLFALGWVCPPCWWAAAVLGRARVHQGKCKWAPSNSLTSSQRTAWRACCAMCCISAVAIIMGCAIRFAPQPNAQEPAPVVPQPPVQEPEPRSWFYYRLAGPQSILQPLSTRTAAPSIAEAIHSSLKLPVDYNSSNIQLLQIGGPAQHRHLLHHGQAGSASSHLQETRSSRAMLEASSSLSRSADKAQVQQRGASAMRSAAAIELTWAFSFAASPALPEPAVLQARALSADTSPNIILFLGLQGVLDFTAASKVTGVMAAANTSNPAADAPKSQHAAEGPAPMTAAIFDPSEVLSYPPPPLPDHACTCRLRYDKSRIPMACPQPWSTPAGNSSVPPALTLRNGTLVERNTGRPAQFRGTNFFGWNTGTLNFDGLWAFDDYEIPNEDSVGGAGKDVLQLSWLGKRRMTNDFAAVVHRMKLLGLNAVRVQFTFRELARNVTSGEEFYMCLLDSDQHIGAKTLDPKLQEWLQAPSTTLNDTAFAAVNVSSGTNESATVSSNTTASVNNTLAPKATGNTANISAQLLEEVMKGLPPYTGMPHPPPPSGNSECDSMPWSQPFTPGYSGPGAAEGNGSLHLTMCNYYLPQGPGVAAVHRFLWQISYFVSQGFYVLLDFQSARKDEPNLTEPTLLAQNWGNLWRMITDLPGYKEHMSGRIMPDLVNEASRWSCQWDDSCQRFNQSRKCAPIIQSFGLASAAIWEADDRVPIVLNGLGQNTPWEKCGGGTYKAMCWGDGFVTSSAVVQASNMANPSTLLTTIASKLTGPGYVLAPHVYPPSITRNAKETAEESSRRWDLSWGLKLQGLDNTSQGLPLPRIPVIIGEFGAKDYFGDSSSANKDTTTYKAEDQVWLTETAAYLRSLYAKAGVPLSWLFWAWNANSGDTRGIVGPETTWREVQWTKVRLLVREFGLTPWYCKRYPDFCATVEWRH